jgi:WD40 repeat protein
MLSDNGKVLVSGFQDGSLLAQFPTNDHPPVPIRPAADGTEFLEPLAVSPDGEQVLITVNAGSEARLWTPTSTAPTPVALGETARIMKAAFSGDGRTVVLAVDDGTVRLVDVMRGTEREQVEVCASTIEQLAVSVDGNRFAAWCTDEPFVHIRTPEGMRQAHADWINPVRVLRFSPDSTSLLIAGVGFNRVLVETRGAARTRTLLGSGDNVYSAAFSHDGRQIVTGAWDKTVEVFTVPPFDRDTTIQPGSVSADTVLKGHRFPVLHVVFSAKDRTIVSTGSDGGVHVWQPRGNGYRRVVLVHPQRLPPSSFVEQVATAYLEERRMVVSAAISEQGSETASGQPFVARFRRWDMQPDSLLARLARRTTVCVPLVYRRTVVPVEQDAAESRTNACLTRNGRAAK